MGCPNSPNNGDENMTTGTPPGPNEAPAWTPSILPPLVAGWMADALPSAIPAELKATCDSCAMSALNPNRNSETVFSADTKCCTYLPTLMNFTVGHVLSDEATDAQDGRVSLRKRLSAGVGVTPLGVAMTPLYSLAYRAGHEPGVNMFGRAPSMRCPHYVDEGSGKCGIWRYRNAVCSTYYCKFNRGAVGHRFWDDLRQLLSCAESELAFWCALEMGIPGDSLRRLLSPANAAITPLQVEIVESEKAPFNQSMWGSWIGREEDFFRACGAMVARLRWADVMRIGGAKLSAWLSVVQESLSLLVTPEVPSRLSVGRMTTRPLSPTSTVVESYHPFDSLVVTPDLLRILHHFDARPLDEVLQGIEDSENIRLETPLVQALADYRILIDRSQPAAAREKPIL